MSVWLVIPSARPPSEANPVLDRWKAQGYKIALYRDCVGPADLAEQEAALVADWIVFSVAYPGYAVAVNTLVSTLIARDASIDWFVTGGDDVLPDPHHTAQEIAEQCREHFKSINVRRVHPTPKDADLGTFGVMQPTGDRWAGGRADRICESPWMGREFCRRINQGRGPLWPEYTHMFVDEEIQRVAEKYGIFWQRRDLIQKHMHHMRETDAVDSRAVATPTPPHLIEANSRAHWMKYEALFKDRRARNFPGSEPL